MSFRVEVSGDYALFSRPELKVERMSYDCITPSAARGILEAVFWKPAIKYVIDEIVVCNPIKFTNIRRNEVSEKASVNKPYIVTNKCIQQRAATILQNVRYVITAHFELTDKAGTPNDTPEKFYNMILRRLRKGQCFHMPYFGTREFPAEIRLIEENEAAPAGSDTLKGERELGLMLYDLDYKSGGDTGGFEVSPCYFFCKLIDGVIDLRQCEVLR